MGDIAIVAKARLLQRLRNLETLRFETHAVHQAHKIPLISRRVRVWRATKMINRGGANVASAIFNDSASA
jgi:hypothetical protein